MERIVFLLFVLTSGYICKAETETHNYVKDMLGLASTCLVPLFATGNKSVTRCADLCMSNSDCCGFSYSNTTRQCIGCASWSYSSQSGTNFYRLIEKTTTCNIHEYNGHFYKFVSEVPATRTYASMQCQQEGGHLVYIETAPEEHFIEGVLAQFPTLHMGHFGTFWIGATTSTGWDNGVSLSNTFTDFCANEPNGNGQCIVGGIGCWDDRGCGYHYSYICEYE